MINVHARAWVDWALGDPKHEIVYDWVKERMIDACAAALAAAVKAKGEADAAFCTTGRGKGTVLAWDQAVDVCAQVIRAHAADIPLPPEAQE